MVNAWLCENECVIGQYKVSEKSNEITAIPELLDNLILTGSTVTIDAMGCQTAIAKKIVDAGANYVFGLIPILKNIYYNRELLFFYGERKCQEF